MTMNLRQYTPGPALLSFADVEVRLGGRAVLNGLTFSAARGSIVAIVGPSGAGKTTLVRGINGLAPVASGSIDFLDASGTPGLAKRPRTATVFQEHALIGRLTAMDNVMLGLVDQRSLWSFVLPWPQDIRRRAAAALAEVDLLEHGDRQVRRLSGGERQRVAMARALVRDPVLLLADEPFASVDPVLRDRLSRLLNTRVRARGMTLLIVLHDLEMALSMADHVIGLRDGRVSFDGPAHRFDAVAYEATYGKRPAGHPAPHVSDWLSMASL
jgi:phosphonate transport system ATP-binding protein